MQKKKKSETELAAGVLKNRSKTQSIRQNAFNKKKTNKTNANFRGHPLLQSHKL